MTLTFSLFFKVVNLLIHNYDMKFWNKLCGIVLFFLVFCSAVRSQSNTSLKLNYKNFILKNVLIASDTSSCHSVATVANKAFQISESTISENFSTACYGFFCRQELKIEKVTRIPFRFRLGSLQQCNYYEGKE